MIRVMREACATCIFRPGNQMDLEVGRLAEMVATVREDDTAVICHSTLERCGDDGQWIIDVINGPEAVCRGSFDRLETTPIQLAKRLGLVELVDS